MATVTRSLDLDLPLAELWRAVSQPDELAGWLGEPVSLDLAPGSEGRIGDRAVVVGAVDDERRLTWTWWPAAGGVASEVELALEETETGSRLTVVERRLPAGRADALASGRWAEACAAWWDSCGDRLLARAEALVACR